MNFNQYTTKAAEAVQDAMQLAGKLKHSQIEVWHLLLALVEQPGNRAQSLEQLDTKPEAIASLIGKNYKSFRLQKLLRKLMPLPN